MAEVARPGMGQDDKDRAGQAEMTRRRIEAGELLPDDQLDSLSKEDLAKQAALRGVDVEPGATKPEIRRALRGGTSEPVTEGEG